LSIYIYIIYCLYCLYKLVPIAAVVVKWVDLLVKFKDIQIQTDQKINLQKPQEFQIQV